MVNRRGFFGSRCLFWGRVVVGLFIESLFAVDAKRGCKCAAIAEEDVILEI
jgi:hypothetical protein